MKLWDVVRRHAVAAGNALTSGIALLSFLVLHWNGNEVAALVALVTFVASSVASLVGVVTADRLLPIAVGVVKMVIYAAVAFGVGAPWNDPMAVTMIVGFVEGVFGIFTVRNVTAVVPGQVAPPVVRD